MILDTEQQKTIILELIKSSQFPGDVLEVMGRFNLDVMNAQIAVEEYPDMIVNE